MSVTITGGGVTATVALRGAMTTAVFDLGDRLVSPLYVAPWPPNDDDTLLGRLRGDFPCIPFGMAPRDLSSYPPAWRDLDPGSTAHPHGSPLWRATAWPIPGCGARPAPPTPAGPVDGRSSPARL